MPWVYTGVPTSGPKPNHVDSGKEREAQTTTIVAAPFGSGRDFHRAFGTRRSRFVCAGPAETVVRTRSRFNGDGALRNNNNNRYPSRFWPETHCARHANRRRLSPAIARNLRFSRKTCTKNAASESRTAGSAWLIAKNESPRRVHKRAPARSGDGNNRSREYRAAVALPAFRGYAFGAVKKKKKNEKIEGETRVPNVLDVVAVFRAEIRKKKKNTFN